jgi:1-acyl-sn-glycerol-3-phosphate acyltransferase
MIEAGLIAVTRLLTGAVVRSNGFDFEPPAQRIYYANHTSHMDTLLLWSLIPKAQRRNTHPAAAKDYWWSSRWRQYLAEHVFRAVPVARQREDRDDSPLGPLEAVLAAGGSLIFFPEGTRGAGGSIQPFKGGLYHLAAKFPHVTMVPVYIDNLNRVLPKGEILPVPIICTVRIGAGFRLDPAETKADFITRAHSRLETLVPT